MRFGVSESKVDKNVEHHYLLNEIIVTPDTEWNELIEAIKAIESNHNSKAIGDNGKAVGILQIHPIMVDHINKEILKENKYSYNDRLNSIKSVEMFNVYQDRYNPTKDYETASRLWNGGDRWYTKKHKTDKYWEKIKSKLNQS